MAENSTELDFLAGVRVVATMPPTKIMLIRHGEKQIDPPPAGIATEDR